MTHSPYDIVPHSRLHSLAEQIYDLAALAFGTYPGVLVPSRAHRDWYVRRPGMDASLSRAALCGDRLVASLFVTVAPVRLGGGVEPVGIVDTVMTHPEHRRRGLARRLLTEAIAGMRFRGLAASLLYTVDGSMPYRFYRGLGYRPYAPVRYCRRPGIPRGAVPDSGLRPMRPGEDDAVRDLLNAAYARHEGYVPLDVPLWRWRKVERPPELAATVWVLEGADGLLGSVTTCRAPIVTDSGSASACVLSDLVPAPAVDPGAVLPRLLGAAPAHLEARMLAASGGGGLERALSSAGWAPEATEVAMVLPLCREADRWLSEPPRLWYPLVESIIGL